MKILLILSFLACVSICFPMCSDRKSCCSADFKHDLCVHKRQTTCRCTVDCNVQGDCCPDYKEFCLRSAPEPCIFGPWNSWSGCSTYRKCDVGYQTRNRDVVQTGNFLSATSCNRSSLIETRQCGDLKCYRYSITRVLDIPQYVRDHSPVSSTIFQYQKGNCKNFEGINSDICIMCDNQDKCGNKALKKGQLLQISHDKCVGHWQKVSESRFKPSCDSVSPYMKVYAFIEKSRW